MSQRITKRHALIKVPELNGEGQGPPEHPSEMRTRLREQRKDGDVRRLKETAVLFFFLTLALGVCVVWAVVLLSRQSSAADKQLTTTLIGQLVYGLICFMAGRNIKTSG
jgi:flagellar biosynthesis protein FlhB